MVMVMGRWAMRPWVGRHGHNERTPWVMGMGMHAMGGWLWAWACVGHRASVGAVGVPWLWQGRGRVGSPYKGIY